MRSFFIFSLILVPLWGCELINGSYFPDYVGISEDAVDFEEFLKDLPLSALNYEIAEVTGYDSAHPDLVLFLFLNRYTDYKQFYAFRADDFTLFSSIDYKAADPKLYDNLEVNRACWLADGNLLLGNYSLVHESGGWVIRHNSLLKSASAEAPFLFQGSIYDTGHQPASLYLTENDISVGVHLEIQVNRDPSTQEIPSFYFTDIFPASKAMNRAGLISMNGVNDDWSWAGPPVTTYTDLDSVEMHLLDRRSLIVDYTFRDDYSTGTLVTYDLPIASFWDEGIVSSAAGFINTPTQITLSQGEYDNMILTYGSDPKSMASPAKLFRVLRQLNLDPSITGPVGTVDQSFFEAYSVLSQHYSRSFFYEPPAPVTPQHVLDNWFDPNKAYQLQNEIIIDYKVHLNPVNKKLMVAFYISNTQMDTLLIPPWASPEDPQPSTGTDSMTSYRNSNQQECDYIDLFVLDYSSGISQIFRDPAITYDEDVEFLPGQIASGNLTDILNTAFYPALNSSQRTRVSYKRFNAALEYTLSAGDSPTGSELVQRLFPSTVEITQNGLVLSYAHYYSDQTDNDVTRNQYYPYLDKIGFFNFAELTDVAEGAYLLPVAKGKIGSLPRIEGDSRLLISYSQPQFFLFSLENQKLFRFEKWWLQ